MSFAEKRQTGNADLSGDVQHDGRGSPARAGPQKNEESHLSAKPDRIIEEGRLAQRESACFTRKRSQVQALHRPPLKGGPKWRNGRRAAFRAQCPTGRGGSNPPFGTNARARSSVWIERSPAEAEVVGSSPTERAISLLVTVIAWQGSSAAEQWLHKPCVAGSNPAPATRL